MFAASSLQDALQDIARAYEAETSGEVTLVFAGSSAVARQVAAQAPADVVLLADAEWGQWLVDAGAVPSVEVFAGNSLVLAARSPELPLDDIQDLPDRLGDGLLAMARVDVVPAGRYGLAALDAVGLWLALDGRVVQAANVRAALRFVERGEVPFAVAYASDLVALPDLRAVYAFAPNTHPPIRYTGAAVTSKGTPFMAYLLSEAGQETLVSWGFEPRPEVP